MAKIDSLNGGFSLRNGKNRRKTRSSSKDVRVSSPSFFEVVTAESEVSVDSLASHAAAAENTSLEELLDDVHTLGERLKERPTMDRIKEYRRAVSGFLQYIVHYTFEAETIEGARFINPMKKQKRYTLIRVVNEKLERLVSGVLVNQLPQLELLRRVEEINGLLVDLLQ
ncbi:YaaR family protein [Sediminispirochaeta bajacaliforniensis]|uniref:YaaR family protein n=1 Tax=Sediminispirochaeta bajacaliforniensis TaxID=148 RepID=UPI0003610CC8|nr:DUF327 family protein [Sediminispirochaeta bajacaliforniensis]